MNAQQRLLAQRCLDGAEGNTMTFPEIVAALTDGGFESYTADFRRGVCTYYLSTGESVEVSMHQVDIAVSSAFDLVALKAAIKEAQNLVPGYTYRGFCAKAKAAGCAGYIVSFSGRRAMYFGRTAEVHTEHFPSPT